jgi:hypothetical protein
MRARVITQVVNPTKNEVQLPSDFFFSNNKSMSESGSENGNLEKHTCQDPMASIARGNGCLGNNTNYHLTAFLLV